jgi:hypothetical protein
LRRLSLSSRQTGPQRSNQGDSNQAGALLILVDLPADFLKTERVNVMIPRHLLGRIDAVSGGNRSRFLVEAAEHK